MFAHQRSVSHSPCSSRGSCRDVKKLTGAVSIGYNLVKHSTVSLVCPQEFRDEVLFRSRAVAEAFVARDPFVLEGLIASYEIRHWADQTLV